jgi:hypothetical protein
MPAMAEEAPIACSLGVGELEQRLAAIAAIGADSLIARSVEGGCHQLRFRSDAMTRQRLEGIVAAEKECCSFLDLTLSEEGDGELLLSIAAPRDAQGLASGLSAAFSATS